MHNNQPRTDTLIKLALEEDTALGDVTSQAVFSQNHRSRAHILAREHLVICGLKVTESVFHRVDNSINVDIKTKDGDNVANGDVILEIEGPTIALLTAERTALNFLQRLSGIATLSKQYADAVSGTGVRIVDTRKTTPAWRALEKYAVRCGGCFNHRASLGEHVLIKENHIRAAGSLKKAVQMCRDYAAHCAKIEVETESLSDVSEALEAGADVIMLDNMAPSSIEKAVALINMAATIEVSGGITLENIADYALPGVDVISIGALTHSAPAADFSMLVQPQNAK